MKRVIVLLTCAVAVVGTGLVLSKSALIKRMGRAPDGKFVVSTGKTILPGSISFKGRPIEIARHPSRDLFAVLNQKSVFLIEDGKIVDGSEIQTNVGAAHHGLVWNPKLNIFYASFSDGFVREFTYSSNSRLYLSREINMRSQTEKMAKSPRPGGLCLSADGVNLYVALLDRNSVVRVNLNDTNLRHYYPVQNLPYDVKLTPDEKHLLVTNWGGRLTTDEDEEKGDEMESEGALIVVDNRGVGTSGTLTSIEIATGKSVHIKTQLHPNQIEITGNHAYICNGNSDTISSIDLSTIDKSTSLKVENSPLTWGKMDIFGSAPCAMIKWKGKLLICNGGDNAIAVFDPIKRKVLGYYPAGYCPSSIALSLSGDKAYVVNTKGNGSVFRTNKNQSGNAHDFEGTVSIIDLNSNLASATKKVAELNDWANKGFKKPNLKVYNGAIKHVLYIIKENRTYDEVFGDMEIGNGDRKLCTLGKKTCPNAQKLAREFTLFDNGYVSGTNSYEGHNFTGSAANSDYVNRFYADYRTYADDGACAMTIVSSGNIWDAALKQKKSVRMYGEYALAAKAGYSEKVNSWFDMWQDRKSGANKIKPIAYCNIRSIRPYMHPNVHYWPLFQSDQSRADYFIADYNERSKKDQVPNLMVLSLPCDHTEGLSTKYPAPRSMVADNDLALGRVVEAVSHSPQWKNTCIFVIEDDAQAGLDHVDGHRTVYMALSPYTKRKHIDSSFYTTISMLRSIEMMLGIPPMNRTDATTTPIMDCFSNTPDLTPYTATPNLIPLDDRNPGPSSYDANGLSWYKKSEVLDWSHIDAADPEVLNRLIWYSVKGFDAPYPRD